MSKPMSPSYESEDHPRGAIPQNDTSQVAPHSQSSVPAGKKRLPMTTPEAWIAPQTAPAQDYQAQAKGELPEEGLPDEKAVAAALKTVHDPEIPVNIYDLGLIYELVIDDAQHVHITMTLTAPACPVAASLVQEVADKAASVPGVKHAYAKVVWDPPWDKDRMSEAAKLELGLL